MQSKASIVTSPTSSGEQDRPGRRLPGDAVDRKGDDISAAPGP